MNKLSIIMFCDESLRKTITKNHENTLTSPHSWVFGDFLCKIYHFINCLSYTASIFILVVICMERYLAIQHPISSKQILTSSRLKGVIVIVWLTSVIYSSPKFLYVQTITNEVDDEIGEVLAAVQKCAEN